MRLPKEIAELVPKTIIFITPHNVIYGDYFHISPGSRTEGDFARFNAPETRFEVNYDTQLAAERLNPSSIHTKSFSA